MCVVHGDDFIAAGKKDALQKLKRTLEEKYEVKAIQFGPGEDSHKEGKMLNRIVRYTTSGFEYEAGPRHAQLIIDELGLQDAKAAKTPGDDRMNEKTDEDCALSDEWTRKFRDIAARINYLAQDRPDIMFAAKEICRGRAKPTDGHWRK